MAKKPFKVKSSSSEHFERSYFERGMGNSRVIAGGELCAVCHNKTVQNMKKISLLLVIFVASLFIVPQITFAMWWNPVSWFEREKVIQLNATSTKNRDLESTTVLKSHNFSSSTDTSLGKIENKPSELVNAILDDSNIENVAELKATIFHLQKEITLLQNTEQVKKSTEPVEKIVYRDRIIEKPTEKIVYRDNITEKPTEKIIYQEKIVEKPIEKIVYRDRVIEKPVDKIVYQDRVVQGTCNTNNTTSSAISENSSSSSEYSDYNFDYKWNSDWNYGGVLSCPSTSRNILLKKAVIKISDESLQILSELEKETQPNTSLALPIVYRLYGAGMGNSYVNLERQDDYTFVWFGGSIPFNCSGSTNSLSFYLGASPEWSNSSTPTIRNIIPVMSQWEIWDGTTNKPVKIR